MFPKLTSDSFPLGKTLAVVLGIVAVLFAIGWQSRTNPDDIPYLRIAGKSFIFNYRVSDVFYGFSAYLTKTVPKNSVIVAEFEDPAGGEPFTVTETISVKSRRYSLRSPSLRGVEAGKPYSVHVRLVKWGDEEVLFDEYFTVTSNISDDVVPDKPLTIGPGYHPNPELRENGS